MATNESELHNSGFEELQQPKMSTGLNVLTILTIIGSAIQLLLSLFSFTSAKKSYEKLDETIAQMNNLTKGEDVPDFAKGLIGNPEDLRTLITKGFENRLPILVLSLAAVILCIIGALQMRKLKKQGYTLYIIGELLPFVTSFAFIGMVAFSGISMLFGVVITLVFILLYTFMRKQLVY